MEKWSIIKFFFHRGRSTPNMTFTFSALARLFFLFFGFFCEKKMLNKKKSKLHHSGSVWSDELKARTTTRPCNSSFLLFEALIRCRLARPISCRLQVLFFPPCTTLRWFRVSGVLVDDSDIAVHQLFSSILTVVQWLRWNESFLFVAVDSSGLRSGAAETKSGWN